MSLRTDSTSLRSAAAVSAVRSPRARLRLPGTARSVCKVGRQGWQKPRELPEKPGRGRQATGPVKSVPGALPAGPVGRNRHQPLSKVSAPADIQGGDEVAEERPSGLNDVLSVRRYANYRRCNSIFC